MRRCSVDVTLAVPLAKPYPYHTHNPKVLDAALVVAEMSTGTLNSEPHPNPHPNPNPNPSPDPDPNPT